MILIIRRPLLLAATFIVPAGFARFLRPYWFPRLDAALDHAISLRLLDARVLLSAGLVLCLVAILLNACLRHPMWQLTFDRGAPRWPLLGRRGTRRALSLPEIEHVIAAAPVSPDARTELRSLLATRLEETRS